MEAFHPPHHTHKPTLAQSNSFKPTAPARVSTAPHSSKKPHLHSRHHHRHHNNAKDVVQSAIQLHPPSSFGDLLRQSSRSSTHSPSQSLSSRAGSVVKADGSLESNTPPPKIIRPEDVVKERAKAKLREEELRSSLQTLSEYSLNSTRRTDDTFYSILEKLASLRSTIAELQELSSLTKELHEDFQNDAEELEEELNGQMEVLHDFEPQEQQVEVLEERVKSGREKAQSLHARLDDARNRVEIRENIEKEWEARMSRRLRVLWTILGTIALIFVLVMFVRRFRLPHTKETGIASSTPKRVWNIHDAQIPPSAKEILSSCNAPRPSSLSKPGLPLSPPPDQRLHIFDEL